LPLPHWSFFSSNAPDVEKSPVRLQVIFQKNKGGFFTADDADRANEFTFVCARQKYFTPAQNED
jgi:hypothetical protein